MHYVSALKFACMMVIEATAVPQITSLLSDIFDIRKEVSVVNEHAVLMPLCSQHIQIQC